MLKIRHRKLLLFAAGTLFCAFAVTLTFVVTAQSVPDVTDAIAATNLYEAPSARSAGTGHDDSYKAVGQARTSIPFRLQTIYKEDFESDGLDLRGVRQKAPGIGCFQGSACWSPSIDRLSGSTSFEFATPVIVIPGSSKNVELVWSMRAADPENSFTVLIRSDNKEMIVFDWKRNSQQLLSSPTEKEAATAQLAWASYSAELPTVSGESVSIVFRSLSNEITIDDVRVSRRAPESPVSIVGRALDANDRGRPNAVITLYEADGTKHVTQADSGGNFRFNDVMDGQRVVVSAGATRNAFEDLELQLAGETRVFWRLPLPDQKTKNGKQ